MCTAVGIALSVLVIVLAILGRRRRRRRSKKKREKGKVSERISLVIEAQSERLNRTRYMVYGV